MLLHSPQLCSICGEKSSFGHWLFQSRDERHNFASTFFVCSYCSILVFVWLPRNSYPLYPYLPCLRLPIGITKQLIPLDSFHQDFWCKCFIHLFPRGDYAERDVRRTPGSAGTRDRLRGKSWARVLLDRVDYRGWALSKPFVACLYN